MPMAQPLARREQPTRYGEGNNRFTTQIMCANPLRFYVKVLTPFA